MKKPDTSFINGKMKHISEGFFRIPKKKRLIGAGVIVAILLILIIVIAAATRRPKISDAEQEGRDYLTSLDNQDLTAIQTQVTTIHKEKRIAMLESNPDAVWGFFNDSLLLGDSRTMGFYVFEHLPEDNILAKSGGKVTDISEDPTYTATISAKKPEYIFFTYGLNDIGIGFYSNGDEYAAAILEQINVVKSCSPDSKIVVSSVLPAVGVGLDASEAYPLIPDYNVGIQKMCEENDITYVDCTYISDAHQDLYSSDGLHLQSDFYIYWASALIEGVE